MTPVQAARQLALRRLRGRDPEQQLRRWWTRKYQAPPTDPRYLAYTPEDLLLEFFEDYYADHPERRVERRTHEATGAQYAVTGDPLIDKWEREIAEGREPDLDEGVPPEEVERECSRLDAAAQASAEAEAFAGIDDSFGEG